VWAVRINCTYMTVYAAHGADKAILRNVKDAVTGDVWVKVYFDSDNNKVSATGVVGPAKD